MDENYWSELIDCSNLLEDIAPQEKVCWNPQPQLQNVSLAMDEPLIGGGSTLQVDECAEKECPKKRGLPCAELGTKACRERMRREKLNDRFSELSAILDLGRPAKTDKLAILGDAIRTLDQLKNESQEYTEMNEMLSEEIKVLKAEKNELRKEKQILKAEKERIEKQLKILSVPPLGFMPTPPPVYSAEVNKFPMLPSYGFVPMWPYFPPPASDKPQDQDLWPPAA